MWAGICNRPDAACAEPEKASVCKRRAVQAGYASWCGRRRGLLGRGVFRGARRLSLGLFKNTQNLALKLREFHREHSAARMQDEIEARGQKIDVAAESLAHASLDPVALVSLAQDFANGEADAWSSR